MSVYTQSEETEKQRHFSHPSEESENLSSAVKIGVLN